MGTFLGILELLAWVVSILSIAAVVTYAVIKIGQKLDARKKASQAPEAPSG